MHAITNRKINRTAVTSVLLIGALIALAGFGLIDTSRKDRMSREALNRSFETRSQIQSYFSLLQDAETGQRGFVITGNSSFLEPYRQALDQMPRKVAQLRTMVDDAQRARLDRVERFSREKLSELEHSIEVRRVEGAPAANDFVQSGVGKSLMDKIRKVVGAMLLAEAEQVENDTAMDRKRSTIMGWIMLGLLLSVAVVTVAAAMLVLRHFRRRLTMELALGRQERQVTAFRSIAEACNLSTSFADAVGRTLAAFGEAVAAASGEAYQVWNEKGLERIEPLACWPAGRSGAGNWAVDPDFSLTTLADPNAVQIVFPDPRNAQAWRILAPVRDEGRLTALLQWAGQDNDLDLVSVEMLAAYTLHQLNRVAERQRIWDALRDVAARQKAIFESAIDAIIIVNESGSIESLNPAAERLFGYETETILRRHVGRLLPEDAETAEASLPTLHGALSGIGKVQEKTAQRRNGTRFPADVALSEMTIGPRKLLVAIVRDISDRKRVEQMKTEFVSTVSHELRTPLTSISGSLGLLAGGTAGILPAPAARLVDIAHKNSDRLVRLINDILDIEKIESGQIAFDLHRLDLKPLVEAAIEANRAYADGFGVTIDFTGEEVAVRGDADRLTQIMTNLLSNAVKYSPEGGEVAVTLTVSDGRVAIAVRDHGTGIPDDFRSRIFSKFAQADASDIRQKGGTGLGLSIVQELVRRHHGCVSFESHAGWGTEFRVELPEAYVQAKEPPQASIPQFPERPVLFCSTDRGTAEAVVGVLQGAGLARKQRPLILHVEDDPDILKVVGASLAPCSEIISVQTLSEARIVLRDRPVDVVILDLMLEHGSGLDLLPDLRTRAGEALPTIIFTAQDADPALSLRVDAVLTKSQASLKDLAIMVERLSLKRAA